LIECSPKLIISKEFHIDTAARSGQVKHTGNYVFSNHSQRVCFFNEILFAPALTGFIYRYAVLLREKFVFVSWAVSSLLGKGIILITSLFVHGGWVHLIVKIVLITVLAVFPSSFRRNGQVNCLVGAYWWFCDRIFPYAFSDKEKIILVKS